MQVFVALALFAIWTGLVRVGISHGSRDSVWIVEQFESWPSRASAIQGVGNYQYSIFGTYATEARPRQAVPGLFGNPTIGSAVDGGDSNNINGTRFTTGIRAGELSSISAYVVGPVDEPPHDQFQLAIYEDARGAPRRLMATSSVGRLVADDWNTVTISARLDPTTSYWLFYNSNGTSGAVNNLTYSPLVGNPLDFELRSRWTVEAARVADRITAIGNLTRMTLAIVVVCLLMAPRRPRAALVFLLGFALLSLVTVVMKDILFAPYSSYPSGHASRVTYVAVAFCSLVAWRGVRVAAVLFVAVVSVAAIYTRGHYSEEIIGGVLLGWAFATAARAFGGDLTRSEPDMPNDATRPPPESVIDLTDTGVTPKPSDQPADTASS
jgi:membrane-associated phospholipid phosphatase